jgi:hypothetical protein
MGKDERAKRKKKAGKIQALPVPMLRDSAVAAAKGGRDHEGRSRIDDKASPALSRASRRERGMARRRERHARSELARGRQGSSGIKDESGFGKGERPWEPGQH